MYQRKHLEEFVPIFPSRLSNSRQFLSCILHNVMSHVASPVCFVVRGWLVLHHLPVPTFPCIDRRRAYRNATTFPSLWGFVVQYVAHMSIKRRRFSNASDRR